MRNRMVVTDMKKVKLLVALITLFFAMSMVCACSDSTDNSAETEETTTEIDTSLADEYIDLGVFTVDTETLMQSIETYLDAYSDAYYENERQSGEAYLFPTWPMEIDNDISSTIQFYSAEEDSEDITEDITDTSKIPTGMKIQYDFYINGDSSFDSMEKATQATMIIMRAVGFTEEDISDKKLHDLIFDQIDYAIGGAFSSDDDLGYSNGEAGNAEIHSRAVRHNDSAKVVSLFIEPRISKKEESNRDMVTFGSYEQDNDTANGKEPIEWLVIDRTDGKMLLLSKMALDNKKYNKEYDTCVWCNCSVHDWLNNEFLDEAFDSEEQKRICETNVITEANDRDGGTSGGADSTDKVFLLSFEELFKYFPDSTTCQPTAYAIAQGSYVSDEEESKGNTIWFLRTPGSDQFEVLHVAPDGETMNFFDEEVDKENSIRPAMWVETEE